MTVSSRPDAAKDATEARLQDALRRDPTNVMRYNDLANHLLSQGDGPRAIALYRAALAMDDSPAALHFNLANALAGCGEDAAALDAYRAALARDPDFAAAHTNRGNLLRRLGRAEDALEAYRRALFLAPRDGAARYNIATALLDLGRPAEALVFFQQAAAGIGEGEGFAHMQSEAAVRQPLAMGDHQMRPRAARQPCGDGEIALVMGRPAEQGRHKAARARLVAGD